MLTKKVESALNEQIKLEFFSSHLYLAMASWAEVNGYKGSADFLYIHAEEERIHALKLFRYVNDRGGKAISSTVDQPKLEYVSISAVFKEILEHEFVISAAINNLVGICMDERDFTTTNFLQWYVTEQIEEESLFRSVLDKLNLLGDDKAKMYMFDNDIIKMKPTPTTASKTA